MYNCPECSEQMIWIADQEDVDVVSNEYQCVSCTISLVKYKNKIGDEV